MKNIEQFGADIVKLPFDARVELVNRLQQKIDCEAIAFAEFIECHDIAIMEQRLADYEAGHVASKPWQQVEAEFRAELKL